MGNKVTFRCLPLQWPTIYVRCSYMHAHNTLTMWLLRWKCTTIQFVFSIWFVSYEYHMYIMFRYEYARSQRRTWTIIDPWHKPCSIHEWNCQWAPIKVPICVYNVCCCYFNSPLMHTCTHKLASKPVAQRSVRICVLENTNPPNKHAGLLIWFWRISIECLGITEKGLWPDRKNIIIFTVSEPQLDDRLVSAWDDEFYTLRKKKRHIFTSTLFIISLACAGLFASVWLIDWTVAESMVV